MAVVGAVVDAAHAWLGPLVQRCCAARAQQGRPQYDVLHAEVAADLAHNLIPPVALIGHRSAQLGTRLVAMAATSWRRHHIFVEPAAVARRREVLWEVISAMATHRAVISEMATHT